MTDRDEEAEERTQWARRRTELANQRTFAAWIRTGLACVATGFAAARLLAGDGARWAVLALGGGLIVLGLAALVLGAFSYRLTLRHLDPKKPALSANVILALTVLFSVAALAAFVMLEIYAADG